MDPNVPGNAALIAAGDAARSTYRIVIVATVGDAPICLGIACLVDAAHFVPKEFKRIKGKRDIKDEEPVIAS